MSGAHLALRARSTPLFGLVSPSNTRNYSFLRSSWPLPIRIQQAHARHYTIPPTGHDAPAGRSPSSKGTPSRSTLPPPPKPPTTTTPGPEVPHARHEVHEGTAQISMPFNPPGGGPSAAPTGFSFTNSPVLDAILTTAIGLAAVFVGGIAYVKWYKKNVLDKIEDAFSAGYDPALELAKSHTRRKSQPNDADSDPIIAEDIPADIRRHEQTTIDHIIWGEEVGHYFMLLGPKRYNSYHIKGAGKGTMIFKSMAACDADGVSVCDAHPDLEVFRLRLGKALNFEFNEDTQTGLFQRRDPREALNKLEKVALRCAQKRHKPLVLVINNVHFFQNNDEGRNMLLQLQQKAEAWAAGGILTVVFTSDDFWPFNVLRKNASRMHVFSIYDLKSEESHQTLKHIRHLANRKPISSQEVEEAVSLVGGRLAYLNKVSKAKDPVQMAKHLMAVEKSWLLSLIPDCDDDVMDEQKWSSCSWLLLQEFVKMHDEQIKDHVAAGGSPDDDLPLPSLSWYMCRQVMTRADFMEGMCSHKVYFYVTNTSTELDRLNIIAIDINHNVRPDSNLILHAAREVTSEEGFDELLQGVRDRIDEIESLHRTRELTFKDLGKGDMVRLAVDKRGEELLATLDSD
ncbi:hypothetical protein BDN70DRAFT_889709 [Pholiota conissans]|uniref:AAA protein C-terminal winged helix domain-containing protein n=1 Tax=Pholiota conissans TaxID=109636 RepID=A0A9P6D6W3_9AGAR|nr:hypothetical protein BDN70DRAFT_889709 [Pholiota conissans]